MELLLLVIYLLLLGYAVVRVLLDTDSTPKILAYLLLILILPLIAI